MSRRNLFIISIIIGLAFIAIVVYSLIPKTYIKLATAPQSVKISIDNSETRSVKNGDSIRIEPGRHTITVSQNEFRSYTKEIDTKNGQTTEFVVALTPLTNAAKKLLEDSKSQIVVQRFYGEIYIQQTNKITKNYPILSILPIQARLYIVSACMSQKYPDNPTKIALCVDYKQQDFDIKPYVLEDIQSRGYNPVDYEIIWQAQSS